MMATCLVPSKALDALTRKKMKLKLMAGLICVFSVGDALAAPLSFETQVLPSERTSMEYGTQINHFVEKVLGHKWVSNKGYGFVFFEKENLHRHGSTRLGLIELTDAGDQQLYFRLLMVKPWSTSLQLMNDHFKID